MRREVPRLALEDQVKLLDGVGKLLATIQLVGQEEVREDVVRVGGGGRRFGLGCFGAVAEQAQVTCAGGAQTRGSAPQFAGVLEIRQGVSRYFSLSAGFWPVADCASVSARMSKSNEQSRSISVCCAALEVIVEAWPSLRPRGDAVDFEGLVHGGPRGLDVGGQVHAGVERAQELGFVAQADERQRTRPRRAPVRLHAKLPLDLLEKRDGGLFDRIQPRFAADRH